MVFLTYNNKIHYHIRGSPPKSNVGVLKLKKKNSVTKQSRLARLMLHLEFVWIKRRRRESRVELTENRLILWSFLFYYTLLTLIPPYSKQTIKQNACILVGYCFESVVDE